MIPGRPALCCDKFGYKDRNGEGYRQAPDGEGARYRVLEPPTSAARERDELWKRKHGRDRPPGSW